MWGENKGKNEIIQTHVSVSNFQSRITATNITQEISRNLSADARIRDRRDRHAPSAPKGSALCLEKGVRRSEECGRRRGGGRPMGDGATGGKGWAATLP